MEACCGLRTKTNPSLLYQGNMCPDCTVKEIVTHVTIVLLFMEDRMKPTSVVE
jgi:hypothetical protein